MIRTMTCLNLAACAVGLAMAGCGPGRLFRAPAGPDTGAVGIPEEVPPIQEAINAANREGPGAGRPRVAAPAPDDGRPAPFAAEVPRGPRPQAAPEPPPTASTTPAAVGEPATLPDVPATTTAAAAAAEPNPAPVTNPAPVSDLPDLASIPESPADAGSPPETPTGATATSPAPTSDPAVRTVANTVAEKPAGAGGLDEHLLSDIAAKVGDEDITRRDLKTAVEQQRERIPPGVQLSEEQQDQFIRQTLDSLIERSLVVQEAKRKFKNPKHWDLFMGEAEKAWREHELPQLIQKYHVSNEFELKKRLADRGRSLDDIRQAFKLQTISQEYLRMEIFPKLKVDYPEMLAFYAENRMKFDRSAEVSWREVVVDIAKAPDRAAARAKVEKALDRIRHGDDFARVARELSDGPKAKDGGLWKTTPGSNIVPAVNAALDTLPLNQVSPILEGPDSFHVVKVEARRAAGPASFPEVQNDIRDILRRQKFEAAVDVFLKKLRSRTMVYRPFLDGAPGSTPTAARVDGPQRR